MVCTYQSKAEEKGEALIEHATTKYCVPDCIIIMDQDSAFMSSLMNYLFNYIHSYIALSEFYTIIWYAYLLKCFTLKCY